MGVLRLFLLLAVVNLTIITPAALSLPRPWLTTTAARLLKLHCTIPVYMAMRNQWRYVDSFEIKFQPDSSKGVRGSTSLATLTSDTYDIPTRGQALHPMAEVEGVVSVRNLSDPRPPHLSILTPFDFEGGDAGVYYCVLNYMDSSRERKTLSYRIHADGNFAHHSLAASDGCFTGKLLQADEINVTWPWEGQSGSQPDALTIEQVIVDENHKEIPDPRTLVQMHLSDTISNRNGDILLSKFSPPSTYARGENYTARFYVDHKLCYPNCIYTCDIGGRVCASPGGTAAPSDSECTDCVVPWVLFGIAAVLAVIAITGFLILCRQRRQGNFRDDICSCLRSVACCSCLNKEQSGGRGDASDQQAASNYQGANADRGPIGNHTPAQNMPQAHLATHDTEQGMPHETERSLSEARIKRSKYKGSGVHGSGDSATTKHAPSGSGKAGCSAEPREDDEEEDDCMEDVPMLGAQGDPGGAAAADKMLMVDLPQKEDSAPKDSVTKHWTENNRLVASEPRHVRPKKRDNTTSAQATMGDGLIGVQTRESPVHKNLREGEATQDSSRNGPQRNSRVGRKHGESRSSGQNGVGSSGDGQDLAESDEEVEAFTLGKGHDAEEKGSSLFRASEDSHNTDGRPRDMHSRGQGRGGDNQSYQPQRNEQTTQGQHSREENARASTMPGASSQQFVPIDKSSSQTVSTDVEDARHDAHGHSIPSLDLPAVRNALNLPAAERGGVGTQMHLPLQLNSDVQSRQQDDQAHRSVERGTDSPTIDHSVTLRPDLEIEKK